MTKHLTKINYRGEETWVQGFTSPWLWKDTVKFQVVEVYGGSSSMMLEQEAGNWTRNRDGVTLKGDPHLQNITKNGDQMFKT